MLQLFAAFLGFGGIGGLPKLPTAITNIAAAAIADSVDRSSYTTPSFTPAAGDLLVVFVRVPGAPPTTLPTMTGSTGITFNRVVNSNNNLYMFVADQVAAAVAQTITVSFGADTALGLLADVWSIAGVVNTGPSAVRQSVNGSGGAGTAPSLSFAASTLNSNPVLTSVANTTNPPALTPPNGFTEGLDQGIATPANGLETAGRVNGFAGTTVTYLSNSATAWRSIFAEFDASIPGAIGAGVHLINRRRRRK